MLALCCSVMIFSGLLVALGTVLMVAEGGLLNHGMCCVDVNDDARSLHVAARQTLLSGLYDCEVYCSCHHGASIAERQARISENQKNHQNIC
ncbi:hypothetical protein LCGC14_1925340 [marine sediment metagenome]|uniref:Uncharacterized protein n=1 Tax=marine sediment metagenome TaxID=412755 RepID=A0A0F9FQ94_9ZZZZ